MTPGSFECPICRKKCKIKGELSKHTAKKHQKEVETQASEKKILSRSSSSTKDLQVSFFNLVIINSLCKEIAQSLSVNKCYPAKIREKIKAWVPNFSEELMTHLNEICKCLSKARPDAEKLYSLFYGTVAVNASTYFPGLSSKVATLFATKLLSSVLRYVVKSKDETKSNAEQASVAKTVSLSDKEISGLQYLGGYVFHSLHKKLRRSSKWKTNACQQSLSLLKAAKLEKPDNDQKLVCSLNRGGIWCINKPAQNLLARAEFHFRKGTESASRNQKLERGIIVKKCLSDIDIMSNYQMIIDSAELAVGKSVSSGMLHAIIELYNSIRSYSYANDIIQNYKAKCKVHKAKSLRKEIKRSAEHSKESKDDKF